MNRLAKIKYFVGNPKATFRYLNAHGLMAWIPDKTFLKHRFKESFGYKLDLNNPQTFNEKTQWLKLYDRRPMYTVMVDKYDVKKFVEERIGAKYIIPTLGIWDRFEDIDFATLPDRFVLKCTHDSQSTVICDKKTMDLSFVKNKLTKRLKMNYYYQGREWPYKNVKPRIIIEKYINEQEPNTIKASDDHELTDYKVMCFNGTAKLIQVHKGRNTNSHTQDFYDVSWKHLDITMGDVPQSAIPMNKPDCLVKMLKLSEILAKDIPFLRVDWYLVDGHLLFGETTFYDAAGFDRFIPDEWDRTMGSWIDCNFGRK